MLYKALRLNETEMISAVGGGGKTSIIFRLARELNAHGKNVLISTTTKIYIPHNRDVTVIIEANEKTVPDRIIRIARSQNDNKASKVLVVGKRIIPGGKMVGFEPETLVSIFNQGIFDYILVEADGAKCKPIKVPAQHEPVIPVTSGVVLGIIGIDAVGKPLTDEYFHRARTACKELGYVYGTPIEDGLITSIIVWEQGLFKNTPCSARKVLVLNKIDGREQQEHGERIAKLIIDKNLDCKLDAIILMSTLLENPVVEVFS